MDLREVPIFEIVYGARRHKYIFGNERGGSDALSTSPGTKEERPALRSSGDKDDPFRLLNQMQRRRAAPVDVKEQLVVAPGGLSGAPVDEAHEGRTRSSSFNRRGPFRSAASPPRANAHADDQEDRDKFLKPYSTPKSHIASRDSPESGGWTHMPASQSPTHNGAFAAGGERRFFTKPPGGGGMGASASGGSYEGRKGFGGWSIDWNSCFQEVLEEPEDTEEQRLAKYERLRQLSTDFVHTAKKVAKTIISENFLPAHARTIVSIDLGGIAGGKKYVHHGILFKFARDTQNPPLYGGSDANAMKAAGHELKGVMRFFPCERLHVPLMAIIDYRGFRMVAESVLPIEKKTLMYGSNDAGVRVHDRDPELSRLMERAASTINIKKHLAGTKKKTAKMLCMPADVEAHKGQDGRYYVIDFARIFPPTAEDDVLAKTTFLYRQFRPEFVRAYDLPLSSDAFSEFGKLGKQEEHNREVREATDYLLKEVVPRYAKELEQLPVEVVRRELTELTHRAGINVRYLGLVRQATKKEDLRTVIFHEMCARVLKNKIWALMREQAKRMRIGCEEEVLRVMIISFLNQVLGRSSPSQGSSATTSFSSPTASVSSTFITDLQSLTRERRHAPAASSSSSASSSRTSLPVRQQDSSRSALELLSCSGVPFEDWWRISMRHRLQHHFCNALSDEELHPDFPLRSRVNMFLLFQRMQQLTGIKLTKKAMEELRVNPTTFRVVLPDIKKVTARVKHMNIVSLYEAKALSIQAMRSDIQHSAERLFSLAMSKFERAFKATPDNTTVLNDYAHTLKTYAFKAKNRAVHRWLQQAFEKLCMAKNNRAICDMTDELLTFLETRMQERQELFQLAHDCFSKIDELAAASPEWLLKWGDVLLERARMYHRDEEYALAGAKLRDAIEAGAVSLFQMGDVDTLSNIELAVLLEVYRGSKFSESSSPSSSSSSAASSSPSSSCSPAVTTGSRPISLCSSASIDAEHVSVNANEVYARRLISFSILSKVAHVMNLHSLVLDRCDHLFQNDASGASLRLILSRAKGTLRHLSLAKSAYLTSRILVRALSVLSCLYSLNLHACYQAFGANAEHLLIRDNPTEVAWWKKLMELNLSDTPIEDSFVERIAAECLSLVRLDLSYTYVSSLALENIFTHCLKLQEVVLDGCVGLVDDTMSYSKGLVHLDHLSLSGCGALSLAGVQPLCEIGRTITKIDLSCCPLNRYVMKSLAQQPLRELSLRGCSTLGDKELEQLTVPSSAINLNMLQLGYCTNISSEAISGLIRSQTSLTYLSLAGCQAVESEVIEAVCTRASTLLSLSVHGCYRVGYSLKQLVVCTRLTRLNMNSVHRQKSGCPHVSVDEILIAIAPVLSNLVKLGIRRTNVSNVGVEKVLSHCKQLQQLDVAYSDVLLGPSGVPSWAGSTAYLRELSLAGCRYVSLPPRDSSVSLVPLNALRVLNVYNSRHLTAAFVQYLVQNPHVLPALEVLVCGGSSKVTESVFEQLKGSREMLVVDYRPPTRHTGGTSSPDADKKPWKSGSVS